VTQETYQTLGTITGGELHVHDRQSFERAMRRFEAGTVTVTIETTGETAVRSLQANRFQWKIFSLIAAESGHTKEDIHDWMATMFLTHTIDVVDKATGEVRAIEVTRGTSKLRPAEHAEFMERVILWAQEFFKMEIPPTELV
jgi:hypothetical protein